MTKMRAISSRPDEHRMPRFQAGVRKSGIGTIGDVRWGTHFCQFYRTKQDLIDILVPYFKAGLENNEFCIWVTSSDLWEDEVREAMRRAMPDFDRYLEKGSIEIVPHTQWYLKDGIFDRHRVLRDWVKKHDAALQRGYDGLRLTGNTFWLEKALWKDFDEYENTVNSVIGNYRMIAICTYSLERCTASEVIDVVQSHQFALIKRENRWARIENVAYRASAYNRSLIEASLDPLVTIGLDGKITDVNAATEAATGYIRAELIGTDFSDYFTEPEEARTGYQRVFREGSVRDYALEIRHRDGHTTPVVYNASVYSDESGHVEGVFAAARDITVRKRAEDSLRLRAREQAVLAKLGQAALAATDLPVLLDEAVKLTADTLGVEYCKILELLPNGEELLLRAGVGWQEGLVGKAIVGAGHDSQAGFTLLTDEPVIVEDLAEEPRFSGPPLLHDHGVVSGMSVIIGSLERPYGVMGAHTTRRRAFIRDEVNFLQAIANVIGTAIERKRAEEKLRHSEANLAEAQRIAHLGNWELDLVHDRLRWSDEIYRIFGLAPQQFRATYEAFLDSTHLEDRTIVMSAMDAALKDGKPYAINHRIVLPDGSIRFVHEQAEVNFDETHKPVRMVGTVEDVTEQKLAEIALRKVNRALKTLSLGNVALVHAKEEIALLGKMCEVLVGAGGYRAAWIGYAEHDARKTVRTVAQLGFETGDLERVNITWADNGRHPTASAIRRGQVQIMRSALIDPAFAQWRDEAIKYRYNALAALPLSFNGQPFGALTIYAAESDAFDEEEVKLLKELVDDLCYGIGTLRTRKDREKTAERLQKSMEGTIQAVASTVEMRDPYTAGHQRRVAQLATAIATELGLPEEEIKAIGMTGAVHDIGKIYVPAEILNRPGPLTPIEMTLVKSHAQVGYEILKDVELSWPVAEMVLQHHERLDGSGYPRGLKGDEILQGARILAVADIVEAMASHRPYRPGLGLEQALNEITTNRGTLFDAATVDACLTLFRENRMSFGPHRPWL